MKPKKILYNDELRSQKVQDILKEKSPYWIRYGLYWLLIFIVLVLILTYSVFGANLISYLI